MATRVEEAFSEREQKENASGRIVEIEIPYIVFEAETESSALAAARAKAGTLSFEGLYFDTVEVTERVNGDTWKVKAVFSREEDGGSDDGGSGEEETSSFAFDTGGGTMHRNQSIRTRARFPKDAPDFGGAIEVDNEGNVNGIDVTMPVFNFTETHTLSGLVVSTSFKRNIAALTGTVNASGFRGFASGEVLFLGASGSKRSKKPSAPWEITYRFAVSPNEALVKVGDIEVRNKFGWDYLWVRYANKVDESKKNVVRKPIAAYVEQVYPAGDFGKLGIGI